MNDFEVLVLAGGLGTRLRSVISDVPKPMAPICGRPFLEHKVSSIIKCGKFRRVILSLGYKAEAIKNYFGAHYNGVPIEYVDEDFPLGTGGAIIHAIKSTRDFGRYVFIANGDTWCDIDLDLSINHMIEKSATFLMHTCRLDKNDRYGSVVVDESGVLTSFGSPDGCSGTINVGHYLASTDFLISALSKFTPPFSLESDFILKCIDSNVFHTKEVHGTFLDIGVPSDYFRAEGIISRKLCENL